MFVHECSIGATTTGGTTISVNQMPSHNHRFGPISDYNGGGALDDAGSDSGEWYWNTASTGGSGSHTHSIPSGSGSFSSTSGSTSTLPTYYKLAYIKRIS